MQPLFPSVQKLHDARFPAFVMMGSIIPVVLDARATSSFFYDDNVASIEQRNARALEPRLENRLVKERKLLWGLRERGKDALAAGTARKSRRELVEIRKALRDLTSIARYIDYSAGLGIIATPFPYSRSNEMGVVPRIYFSREPIDSDELIDLRARKFRGKDTLEFEEHDGLVHGYPECCIKYHIRQTPNTVFSGFPMSQAESMDEMPGFKGVPTDVFFNKLGDSIYQFFVEEFYPCSYTTGIPCRSAIDIGKRVFNSLRTVVPEGEVRQFFVTNYMLALEYTHGAGGPSYSNSDSPNVGSYKLPFSVFVKSAFGDQ